jgi:hypothetical protein
MDVARHGGISGGFILRNSYARSKPRGYLESNTNVYGGVICQHV